MSEEKKNTLEAKSLDDSSLENVSGGTLLREEADNDYIAINVEPVNMNWGKLASSIGSKFD